MGTRLGSSVLLAVPGLALAVAGLVHPHQLDAETARRWFELHVAGMAFFPLLGLALVVLVRGRRDPLSWVVRVASFVYAVCYTTLDIVYGVIAGYVTDDRGPGYRRSDDFAQALGLSEDIGRIGSWALVVAGLALLVDQVVRRRPAGLPAVLLPVGAWLVHLDHIFAPQGVAGVTLIGLATGALAWNLPEIRSRGGATSSTVAAS